jgi:hypothetical protein
MFGFLDGYTTKIVALATVVFGISGAVIGELSVEQAFMLVSGGLMAMGLRDAVDKKL